jgi:hypothetical protein
MRRLVLAGALLGLAASPQQGVNWMKLEQARFMANSKDKLVLVYIACDPETGMSSCMAKDAEVFGDGGVSPKRQDQFYFARVTDRKAALELKATRIREAIFIDGDATEIYRATLSDGRSLEKALGAAADKYAPREIAWRSYEAKETASVDERKKLVMLGFSDEKKESVETLKTLEDRQLTKYHEKFIFMKAAFKKDSEEAKKWGVSQAPLLVIIDPAKGEVLDRIGPRKTAKEIKPLLVKALGRLEKK